jgi:Ser/Thr protein kinase RdoA (MazF antagonist)
MRPGLVRATWPALDDAEVREVLRVYTRRLGPEVANARVVWHSPRPMSAAGLVEIEGTTVFVKRHHPRVRSTASLLTEHRLAAHLQRRGVSVPRVVATNNGSTVAEIAGARYEVTEKARGVDFYAEMPSWSPYGSSGHAAAAGAALARFHAAAATFEAAPRPFGPLMTSVALAEAARPGAALRRLLAARPALRAALERVGARSALDRHCVPALERASRVLRRWPPCWGHGDWHPSNLMWSDRDATAAVVAVFDLGLANRTAAVHDVAVAIERSFVPWLSTPGRRKADLDGVDAFLDGYRGAKGPWDEASRRDIADVLPGCHVEYALSEVEYFAAVVGSETDAALAADDYLVGHCRYFEAEEGTELLGHLRAGS